MGASASCPAGTTLNVDACYGACPTSMESNALYRKLCASKEPCPTGTSLDATGLACEKTVAGNGIMAKTTAGCDANYTEWVKDTCYKNCPSTFLENGFDCRKKTVVRESFVPQCSILTSFNNGVCEFDYFGLLLVFLTIFIARYYYTLKKK